MNTGPSVVVNKSGFFSSLVKGIFGTVIAIVVCGTVIGVYGLKAVDNHALKLVEMVEHGVPEVLVAMQDWQDAMPPAIRDALNDRRDFDYRSQLAISSPIRSIQETHGGGSVVTLEITNQGDEIVSLLALRLFIEDDGRHSIERISYVATPLAIEDEWRGPLLPGQTRRIAHYVPVQDGDLRVSTELTDLRLWNGPAETPIAAAPETTPE